MTQSPACITILKRGFIWNLRYLIYTSPRTIDYVCRREWRRYRFVWCVRDSQNKELLYFPSQSVFRLADGRERKIKYSRYWFDILWCGARKMRLIGDQCEDLFVSFIEPRLHWQITTSHDRVVAAARRMLFGWRLGYEVDIYEPAFLEEVIGFAMYERLQSNRNGTL